MGNQQISNHSSGEVLSRRPVGGAGWWRDHNVSALGDPVLCSCDTKDLKHKGLSFYVFYMRYYMKKIPPAQP